MFIKSFPGYRVTINFNGYKVTPNGYGFLNKKKSGTFSIEFSPKKLDDQLLASPIYKVMSGNRIVVVNSYEDITKITIPISKTLRGDIGYVENGYGRFLTNDSNGDLVEYEASIFTQAGCHYFVMQRNWKKTLRTDESGRLYINDLNWPSLLNFCDEIRATPSLNPPKNPINIPLDLSENEGHVEWFNVTKGVGAIRTNTGKLAKVHYSEISNEIPGPKFLLRNQLVQAMFEPIPENNRQNTSFPLVAKNVVAVG